MRAIQPYLFFNGNCREAMQFYAGVFNTSLNLTPYGDMHGTDAADKDRVMNASFNAPDGSTLMASDAPTARPVPEGGNFNVSIICDSADEQDHLFAGLSDGGHIHMPLQEMFWGARFGMLRDKFGVGWMLSFGPGAGN